MIAKTFDIESIGVMNIDSIVPCIAGFFAVECTVRDANNWKLRVLVAQKCELMKSRANMYRRQIDKRL